MPGATTSQAEFERGLKYRLEEAGYENITLGDVRELLGLVSAQVSENLRRSDRVTVRGLGIFSKKKKPATKARKGINPFTKEEQMFKAKPASTQVKVRAAKVVRDAVERKK
jgi:DNA-binding protein HU-beta